METESQELQFDDIFQRLLPLVLFTLAYLALGRFREYRRLAHFGGPRTSGILCWWHSRAVLSGRAHEHYGHVTERYGPIARIAPNHLVTSDPEFWAKINAVRSPYKKAEWYYHAARFEPGKDNVFTDCEIERHDMRRKRMAAGYSGKENPSLEPTIDTHVKELVALVRKYASHPDSKQPSTPMDLAQKIPFFTLDTISHVGLGSPFGDLKADRDVHDYLAASEFGLQIGNSRFALGTTWLRDVPFIGSSMRPSENDASGFGRMMAEARKIVEERRMKSVEDKSDMLASFVRHGVAGEDLFQEVFEQILAGSDTTAAGIRAILLYVIGHPRVCAKLQKEIDGAVKAAGDPEVIQDAEARRLPYLGAVVREGLRIHPPVATLSSRVTPDSGDTATIDGKDYFIPGGTLIGYAAWSMHRTNRAVYGPDAHVFRPERWLLDESIPEEKERLARMTRTNDLVFGYGRWGCLGRNIALIEMHKCVFELFRHFEFGLTDPGRAWRKRESLGLFAIGEMWVDVTVRQ